MGKKKTKVEKIGETNLRGKNEEGKTVDYSAEVNKLTFTDKSEKIVEKPKPESEGVGIRVSVKDTAGKEISSTTEEGVKPKGVRQSEVINATDINKEYIGITGAPVEVNYDADTQVEAYIGEAYDYFMACQVRGLRLESLNPEHPERAPKASEIDFNQYIAASLEYWKKQAADGWPDIVRRPEILYSPKRNEDLSLIIMAAEESIIAYERYMAMTDTDKRTVLNNGCLLLEQQRKERAERREEAQRLIMEDALRGGGNIEALLGDDKYLLKK